MKKSQKIMVWFLPLIVIGGLIYPLLGYLVVAAMATLLTTSFLKGRYWCAHLCPRGAFLDLVLSKVSLQKPFPKFFMNNLFRWSLFVVFMGVVVVRLVNAGANIYAIGAVFVGACFLTTMIAIILGSIAKHRAWCAICPMGLLQEKISKMRK